MKTKSRRDLSDYPSLDPTYTTKIRREYKDYDYLDQLSPEELEWFDKFNAEYYDGSIIDEPGENVHPTHENMEVYDTPAKKGKEYCPLRRELMKKNNLQNNDVYGISRAGGLLSEHVIDNQEQQILDKPGLLEDILIHVIDKTRKKKKP